MLKEIMSLRSCPVCSGDSVSVVHTQHFILSEDHPLAGSYDVVSCKTCGFIYADVKETQESYDRYYAEFSKYGDSSTSTGSGENPFDQERLKRTTKILCSWVSDPKARILDIGCANGGLLKEIRNLGYSNLFGIDPAEICVENTKENAKVDARVGSISNLPQGIGKFDLVILSHVLEHVLDLRAAIGKLRNLLSEGGCIYVEVPNAAAYADMIVAPFQDFNVEHINHFSDVSLNNLFGEYQFSAVSQECRTILTGKNIHYPVVHAFFQAAKTSRALQFDRVLNQKIQEYIDRSQSALSGLETRVREILAHNKDLIVWGTGQTCMVLLANTPLRDAQIASFVDGNPVNQGKKIKGIPVLAPHEVTTLPPYPILITTLLHHQAILETIRANNLRNPVFTLASV